MNFKIAKKDDISSVLDVLNKTTLALQKKEIHQWSYPWAQVDIQQDIDNGFCFILMNEGQIIATFTMREVTTLGYKKLNSPCQELGRIAILPENQGDNIGARILYYVHTFADQTMQRVYLDCWAGNEKLKTFYTRHGFVYLGDFPENDYVISVFTYAPPNIEL